jgi:hypothetical protein
MRPSSLIYQVRLARPCLKEEDSREAEGKVVGVMNNQFYTLKNLDWFSQARYSICSSNKSLPRRLTRE